MGGAQFRIVSEIYESGRDYPVVVHTFYGRTPEEAESYYAAHLASDAFFRGCIEDQGFDDFACFEQHWLEKRWLFGWVPAA